MYIIYFLSNFCNSARALLVPDLKPIEDITLPNLLFFSFPNYFFQGSWRFTDS